VNTQSFSVTRGAFFLLACYLLAELFVYLTATGTCTFFVWMDRDSPKCGPEAWQGFAKMMSENLALLTSFLAGRATGQNTPPAYFDPKENTDEPSSD
jgi:hypothetical protein